MWKYVSRRVKDTIELGIHVRKSFSVQQSLNDNYQQQQNERKQNLHHLDNSLVPHHQDPSRDKDKGDENFKRKYNRLHHENKCFLNALTWSTAIVTGFYTAQLLCLYKRKQHLGFGRRRCYYSKYLEKTSQTVHHNVRFLLSTQGQPSLIPLLKLGSFFNRSKGEESNQKRTNEDEFTDFKLFVDPGYQQYENYFEKTSSSSSNLYNVTQDVNNNNATKTTEPRLKKEIVEKQDGVEIEVTVESSEEKEDTAINEAITKLAHIIGELEFQMGIESFLLEDYYDAIDHFKLSAHHNHPGGVFNLALCYEQGIGVKRNMNIAKRFYEIASELGHAKAFYNLGVYHAQGLGGANKNFHKAKMFFEKSAELGNVDATKALSFLLPHPKKHPVIDEFQEDEINFKQKSTTIVNHNVNKHIAVI